MLPRRALVASGLLVAFVLAGAPAAAQGPEGASEDGRLGHFEQPASSITKSINDLYYLILPISLVVGVLVEVLIIYAILRYRARPGKVEVTQEHERGHTRLEIAWTIPPAVILLVVGLLSTQTLIAIENPERTDFELKVIASQWIWNFEYPDGTTSTNRVGVEAGKIVRLNVTATDVIHNWAVPALGVKIDAVPGRINTYFMKADEPGVFQAQCMEYCGGAHGYMRAAVEVVPAGSTANGWVVAAGAGGVTNCAQATNVSRTVPMRLVEGGGSPWSIDPRTLTLGAGEHVCISVINPAGQAAPHNLTFLDASNAKVAAWDPALQPGREGAIVHAFAPGQYTYICAVPGHRELGMQGTLTVS